MPTTITVRSLQGLQQEITAGKHHLVADEPLESGGNDAGPNPYELLLASLGACKCMTARLYARRKGWNLGAITVELTHSRDYSRDCEDCSDQNTRIDRITLRVELEGDLDPPMKTRLREIMARCPVHQTLTGRLVIEDQS